MSYFPKDDGQKCLKRTKINTLISTQQTPFFVLLSVHAKGKTDSTNYGVPLKLKEMTKMTN